MDVFYYIAFHKIVLYQSINAPINSVYLSINPAAIHILEKNINKVDWRFLSLNPNAIHILEKNMDKIVWDCLSKNPNAIHILEKNIDKIDWNRLSENVNAIHILEKNLDKVDWSLLSLNRNAIHILAKNIDKIDWVYLSQNLNANHILENNLDKIDKINWFSLSKNPSIFQIDYDAMRENGKGIAEEIAKIIWHPSRMSKWPEDKLIDDNDLNTLNMEYIQNIPITSTILTIKRSIKLRS